jgi:hypothetical protein
MEKFKKFISHPIVQFLGPTGFIAVITWIISRIREVSPLWLWMAILVSAAVTLWIVFQVKGWQEKHKKGFSTLTDEQMANTLKKWLDKRHYSLQNFDRDEALFYFVVTDTEKRPINVLRPKTASNIIRLVLAFNEKDIEDIPQPQQQTLRFNIGIEMARFGVLYCEKPVLVQLDLPIDDLVTENTFLSTIDRIRQAHVLMMAHIGAALAQAKLSKQQVLDKKDSQT